MKKNNRRRKPAILFILLLTLCSLIVFGQYTCASWVEEEEGMKYEDEDGEFTVGFAEIDGSLYYFNGDGYLVTGKFYDSDTNAYYYADKEGIVQVGVIQNKRYFYLTDETGKIQTGFIEYDGKRYYFNDNAQMLTGWFKYGEQWYYADTDGSLQTGFITLDGYRYYLKEDGTRVSDAVMQIEGATYVFNQDGSIDENATAMYPVYQYMEQLRKENGAGGLALNAKVQACAMLRAAGLVQGFQSETGTASPVETLLKNRGIKCGGGYEFSYGGIEEYSVERLISDMEKDNNLIEALGDSTVKELGLGMYEKDNIIYYDIIFIRN
ncbi:MAG: hypothetical protein NC300_03170 [Bacteroidales bacterium]|nr:hypothetical protein [Clostridium sp.]MCM1203119.1 hypothetical protein [Bacteroidales bacterium]